MKIISFDFRQEKKEENPKYVLTEVVEVNPEKGSENYTHNLNKEYSRTNRAEDFSWNNSRSKNKDKIRLSPKISSLSPKFSHQMFVKTTPKSNNL